MSIRLPVGLLWSLASGGGTRGSRRTRLSRMRWGLLDFSYSFLSFCTSDENQTLMEDMISTQTNFFPWPKSWPDELKNINPTSSNMDLLPSTAPTWPRCSPSGTPRRPPPPPRLTEKTWQVSQNNLDKVFNRRFADLLGECDRNPNPCRLLSLLKQSHCKSVVSSRDNGYIMFSKSSHLE